MTSTRRPAGLLAIAAALLLIPASSAAAKGHDRDHDQVPDRWEKRHHVARASADADGDGLTNRSEFLAGTDPRRDDSDRDGTLDGAEDRDGDKVDNLTEQLARTNPAKRDSDRDRTADGAEDPDRDGLHNAGESLVHSDPRNPDTDDDGVRDGDEHAGVLAAVDGAVITIDLAAGGTLRAAVDSETLIACDDGSAGDDAGEPWTDEDPSADGGYDEGADEDVDVDVEVLDDGFDDDGTDLGDDSGDGDLVDDCAPALQAGMLVYEADVEAGPAGLVVTYLDLIG